MVDLTPMLVVRDVPASSKWYQDLLELTSAHGGDEFEMLVDDEGKMQLFLHHREFGEHPGMSDPGESRSLNGMPNDTNQSKLSALRSTKTRIRSASGAAPAEASRYFSISSGSELIMFSSSGMG